MISHSLDIVIKNRGANSSFLAQTMGTFTKVGWQTLQLVCERVTNVSREENNETLHLCAGYELPSSHIWFCRLHYFTLCPKNANCFFLADMYTTDLTGNKIDCVGSPHTGPSDASLLSALGHLDV